MKNVNKITRLLVITAGWVLMGWVVWSQLAKSNFVGAIGWVAFLLLYIAVKRIIKDNNSLLDKIERKHSLDLTFVEMNTEMEVMKRFMPIAEAKMKALKTLKAKEKSRWPTSNEGGSK